MNEMNDKKETWIRLNGWARERIKSMTCRCIFTILERNIWWWEIENENILDRVRLVVLENESSHAVNVDRLVRSIHYIIINENILDRVRLVV